MRKVIFFFLFPLLMLGQKTEFIKLTQSIKDKRGMTKSLTLIDTRADKVIGKLLSKGEEVEMKFADDDDLKGSIEKWFEENNEVKGNNDIVLILEELHIFDEQDPSQKKVYGKAKIKISSFIKRNERYYFVSRFDNIIVSDQQRASGVTRYLADQISAILSEFIKASYSSIVSGEVIPQNEIENYHKYLSKHYKAFNDGELKDGVYLNFKSFRNQVPEVNYSIEKNRKGKVVRVKYNGLQVSMSEVYCYVDAGKVYRFTPLGFVQMSKGSEGFFIVSSRQQLFKESNSTGIIVGAAAGGVVGALIGAAIDSGSNAGAMTGFGFRSSTISKVSIDSLTGAYVFEK